MMAIYYFSSQPGEWVVRTFDFTADHDWGHLVAYFALGAAVCWGLRRYGMPYPWIAAFCFTWLYGLTDELHQLAVPGRDFELSDLLANGFGALAGVLFVKRLGCWSTPKEKIAATPKVRIADRPPRAKTDRKRRQG